MINCPCREKQQGFATNISFLLCTTSHAGNGWTNEEQFPSPATPVGAKPETTCKIHLWWGCCASSGARGCRKADPITLIIYWYGDSLSNTQLILEPHVLRLPHPSPLPSLPILDLSNRSGLWHSSGVLGFSTLLWIFILRFIPSSSSSNISVQQLCHNFHNSGKGVFLPKTALALTINPSFKCFNVFPFACWWSLPTAAQQQFSSRYFSVQLNFLTFQTLMPQRELKITLLPFHSRSSDSSFQGTLWEGVYY